MCDAGKSVEFVVGFRSNAERLPQVLPEEGKKEVELTWEAGRVGVVVGAGGVRWA